MYTPSEKISGMICAPFTPFTESGSLDLSPIKTYAATLIAAGNIGVFVNGSSGEGHLLTEAERVRAAEEWMAHTPEGYKTIIHVGSNSIETCCNLARHAQSIGAYAVSIMAPMFPAMRQVADLADFCERVAAAAPDLPFYYYHIPVLSGASVPMVPLLQAVENRIPNFAGIKFTAESLYEYTACYRYGGGKFDILAGQDETYLAALMLTGGKGSIGGTFNYASSLYRGIYDAFMSGDFETARRLQYLSQDMIDIVARYGGNIVCGKYIMKLIGLDMGPNRMPFRALSDADKAAIKEGLQRIGFFDFCNKIVNSEGQSESKATA